MPGRAARAASGTLLAAGLLGAAIHASQLYAPTPPPGGGGSALNVLLASLTAFFSAEALWALWPGSLPLSRGPHAIRCRAICSPLLLSTPPLLFVLYAVGYRLDAAAWCVPLLLSLALCAIAQRAWRRGKAPPPESPRLLSEEEGSSLQQEVRGDNLGEEEDAHPPPSPCRACCCPPAATTPPARRALFFLHAAAWAAAASTLLLLLGGAGTIAVGWRRFPRRGSQYDLRPLGVPSLVHAWCSGPPRSPTQPTIWLDFGGGGHSSSDALGLQLALNAAGRRVCTQDPPGTAWSPLLQPADTIDLGAAARQRALMEAMGEEGPFVLVGSMDGGAERIYAFALAFPALTSAIVPMQYGVAEFEGYARFKGLAPNDARVIAYAKSQISSRVGACDLIRFLAVQWGLVAAFTPPSPTFVPQAGQEECHFLNLWHEGQWDMQCRLLQAQVRDPDSIMAQGLWQANRSLAAGVAVLSVGNFPRDPCAASSMAAGSEECTIFKLQMEINEDFMRNMTTMTPRSVYVNGCVVDGDPFCKDWAGGGGHSPFCDGLNFELPQEQLAVRGNWGRACYRGWGAGLCACAC